MIDKDHIIVGLRVENARLLAENDQLKAEVDRLTRKVAKLESEIRRLRSLLDEKERKAHRQTVRFSRDQKVAEPKKPGRPKGHRHERRPMPEHIDYIHNVTIDGCPDCGVHVPTSAIHRQFQIDLPPVSPVVTLFNIHCGYCPCCHKRVQGRHPDQISNAVGAASVQIGPVLLSMAAELKHRLGVTYRKITDFFSNYLNVDIAPSTFCRAEQRLAEKAKPTYNLLIEALRTSGVVHADETGWRVGALSSWLWVFSSANVTVYAIRAGERSRSSDVPEEILGSDFNGILVVDGLAAYDVLNCEKGRCCGHLLRRAHRLEEGAADNDARYLRQLIDIIKDAIALNDLTDPISERTYWRRVTGLENRLDRWLAFHGYQPGDELIRLVNHVRAHRREWLLFLYEPDVPPTNNHAERMIRPAVVTRRIGACNRSLTGALTHQILMSLMVTWRRQDKDFLELAIKLWRSVHPEAQELPDRWKKTDPALAAPMPTVPVK